MEISSSDHILFSFDFAGNFIFGFLVPGEVVGANLY